MSCNAPLPALRLLVEEVEAAMTQRPAGARPDDARSTPRRVVCEGCSTEFDCTRNHRGECWCAAEPYRLPTPLPAATGSFTDCLCPSCLRKVAQRLLAARSA
jgi:hypothetical protein